MTEILIWSERIPTVQLWGVVVRGLAFIYAISFASLIPQITALAGSRGITPLKPVLAAIRRDFSPWRRWVYFPTLLWLSSSDRALKLVPVAGLACGVVAFVGGPAAWWALLGCWALYLSLDLAVDLVYPWDCLLLECGFLALFLPRLALLPDVALIEEPNPALAWAFRWLLFRLLFGFGKYKFLGHGKLQFSYLRSFLVSQPLPSPLGLLSAGLSEPVHRLALGGVFAAEMLLPFLIFFPAPCSLVPLGATILMMCAIWLNGNFGFFNLIVLVLCLPLADGSRSIAELGALASYRGAAGWVGALSLLAGLVYLPFNSWVTRAWPYWPAFAFHRWLGLRLLARVARWLAPFRLVHAYGVFSPDGGPPVRWVVVLEGSEDGENWFDLPYRFLPMAPESKPRFIAPFHPRLDHFILYDAYGVSLTDFLAPVFGIAAPYRFSRVPMIRRLAQRLLEGSPEVWKLLGTPMRRLKSVRARIAVLQLRGERGERGGATWSRSFVDVHMSAVGSEPGVFEESLREPDLFHWEDRVWRQRARASSRQGLSWDQLQPVLLVAQRGDWASLAVDAAQLRESMGPERWRDVERTVNRLALAFEPVMASRGEGTLKTQFDVGLYAYSLVSLGEGPYQDALARGDAAGADATEADIQRGLFLLGIFWTDVLLTHARKARWRRLTMGTIAVEPPVYLPGFVRRMPLVEECFMKVRGGGTTSQVSPTFSKMRNMKKSGSTSLGR